jgi:hypothetical protein
MADETRIVEPEGPAVAREQLVNTFPRQPKHVSLATNMHITIQVLFETVFSLWSILRFYKESPDKELDKSCVEVGSNNSTVTLRVVGGNGKGTQCLGI